MLLCSGGPGRHNETEAADDEHFFEPGADASGRRCPNHSRILVVIGGRPLSGCPWGKAAYCAIFASTDASSRATGISWTHCGVTDPNRARIWRHGADWT